MDDSVFLRGLIIGFAIAAPVGPIGVLCIRQTLARGWPVGLAAGLGAATADALYGSIAGFGLTVVSSALVSQQFWLRLLGGLFLCYLGGRTLLSQAAQSAIATEDDGLAGTYLSTLFLTLTNPATIMSFAAIFAGLGLASTTAHYTTALLLVVGVFLGSALWWLLLSGGTNVLRQRLTSNRLTWINRVSGAIITAFGLLALVSLFV